LTVVHKKQPWTRLCRNIRAQLLNLIHSTNHQTAGRGIPSAPVKPTPTKRSTNPPTTGQAASPFFPAPFRLFAEIVAQNTFTAERASAAQSSVA